MKEQFRVRPLDPASESEIRLVAERMRWTLVEVLGEERGTSMYTLEWLIERVKFHLDTSQCSGEVLLAINEKGFVAGHTIVRAEREEEAGLTGLFSTTYVHPDYRRRGVADALLDKGEAWMKANCLKRAVTYTDRANEPLQKLYIRRGYRCEPMPNDFVALSKDI